MLELFLNDANLCAAIEALQACMCVVPLNATLVHIALEGLDVYEVKLVQAGVPCVEVPGTFVLSTFVHCTTLCFRIPIRYGK